MRTLTSMEVLIERHLNAEAEHSRLFDLSDWGLVDGASVTAALEPIDDTLIAICAARPATPKDQELRRRFLEAHLLRRLEGCPDLTTRAVKALIGGGVQ